MNLRFTLIAFLFFNYIQAQDTLQIKVESSLEYNFRVPRKLGYESNIKSFSAVHESILFTLSYKNNDLTIGPQISRIDGYLYSSDNIINKNPIGLSIGYQHNFPIFHEENSTFFITRLTFSLYKISKEASSLGPPNTVINNYTVLENNIFFGLKKQFKNNLYINSGLGFGSTKGFFLMIDAFMLSTTLGVGFQF